jgi:hypothetical protein
MRNIPIPHIGQDVPFAMARSTRALKVGPASPGLGTIHSSLLHGPGSRQGRVTMCSVTDNGRSRRTLRSSSGRRSPVAPLRDDIRQASDPLGARSSSRLRTMFRMIRQPRVLLGILLDTAAVLGLYTAALAAFGWLSSFDRWLFIPPMVLTGVWEARLRRSYKRKG